MIYIVEDDNSIRKLILYNLTSVGLSAKGFAKPSEFWEELKKNLPKVVLLDIMLPEEDGLSILKKLRRIQGGNNIQIIMLTAKGSEYDKIIGLDSGADDYITKPFSMPELTSRVKSALRRTMSENDFEYNISGLSVNPSKRTVYINQEEVPLTYKEFELLLSLIKGNGKVLSRDYLLNNVWGYDYIGESRTVDVHIRTLRQKLGEFGDCIETIRGVGYKFGKKSNKQNI